MKTKKFGKHKTEVQDMTGHFIPNAEQYIITFENGYGASIIRNEMSYGGSDGLFELAVVGKDGGLCYDTPITSDVIGHLTGKEVGKTLDAIKAL